MFQMVQMKEEHVIINSNILPPCGYLKYHLTTEKDFNTIQFQRVNIWISNGLKHTIVSWPNHWFISGFNN